MRKRVLLAVVTCWCFTASAAFGQASLSKAGANSRSGTAPKALPEFAAATIKPAQPGAGKAIGLYTYPGGRVYAGLSTLTMLVCDAYNLQPFQVEGGPGWVRSDTFDVSGVPPESSSSRQLRPRYISDPPSQEQREMLQALLSQRFGLQSHRVTKQDSVLFLQKGSKPLRIAETTQDNGFPVLVIGGRGDGGMQGIDVTMPFMARRLTLFLDRPVVDRTGLDGSFDFQSPAPLNDSIQQSESDFVVGITESVKELGLVLNAGKAPIEFFVIDQVHRPTPD